MAPVAPPTIAPPTGSLQPPRASVSQGQWLDKLKTPELESISSPFKRIQIFTQEAAQTEAGVSGAEVNYAECRRHNVEFSCRAMPVSRRSRSASARCNPGRWRPDLSPRTPRREVAHLHPVYHGPASSKLYLKLALCQPNASIELSHGLRIGGVDVGRESVDVSRGCKCAGVFCFPLLRYWRFTGATPATNLGNRWRNFGASRQVHQTNDAKLGNGLCRYSITKRAAHRVPAELEQFWLFEWAR